MAGLNPHGGEGGGIGREEIEIVAPAVRALQALGIDASGPYPADTLFPEAMRAHYDAAICLYHDQALIPVKMLDFWGGVNVTLGLPDRADLSRSWHRLRHRRARHRAA